jgi:hypothetical protein
MTGLELSRHRIQSLRSHTMRKVSASVGTRDEDTHADILSCVDLHSTIIVDSWLVCSHTVNPPNLRQCTAWLDVHSR